jgi:hypothetical protein
VACFEYRRNSYENKWRNFEMGNDERIFLAAAGLLALIVLALYNVLLAVGT